MPGRRGDPDRDPEDLAAELRRARELRPAAGQDDPGRQHVRPAAGHLPPDQLERLAHPGLDDLADLAAADRPAGVLAEDGDRDLLVVGDRVEVAGPVLDLQLLGDLEAGLQAEGDVVGHVVPADRQDRGPERRAVREHREIDRAGADVGDRDAELLLGLAQDGVGRGERRRRPARRSSRRRR